MDLALISFELVSALTTKPATQENLADLSQQSSYILQLLTSFKGYALNYSACGETVVIQIIDESEL